MVVATGGSPPAQWSPEVRRTRSEARPVRASPFRGWRNCPVVPKVRPVRAFPAPCDPWTPTRLKSRASGPGSPGEPVIRHTVLMSTRLPFPKRFRCGPARCQHCGRPACWHYPGKGVEYLRCDACLRRGCSCQADAAGEPYRDRRGRKLPCVDWYYDAEIFVDRFGALHFDWPPRLGRFVARWTKRRRIADQPPAWHFWPRAWKPLGRTA